MNDSGVLKWVVCLFFVSFCVGILCLTPSLSQEKPAISPAKEGVKKQQPMIASENQPEIYIEKAKHDAGEVYEGSEIVHSFIVKNKGQGELRIARVKPG